MGRCRWIGAIYVDVYGEWVRAGHIDVQVRRRKECREPWQCGRDVPNRGAREGVDGWRFEQQQQWRRPCNVRAARAGQQLAWRSIHVRRRQQGLVRWHGHADERLREVLRSVMRHRGESLWRGQCVMRQWIQWCLQWFGHCDMGLRRRMLRRGDPQFHAANGREIRLSRGRQEHEPRGRSRLERMAGARALLERVRRGAFGGRHRQSGGRECASVFGGRWRGARLRAEFELVRERHIGAAHDARRIERVLILWAPGDENGNGGTNCHARPADWDGPRSGVEFALALLHSAEKRVRQDCGAQWRRRLRVRWIGRRARAWSRGLGQCAGFLYGKRHEQRVQLEWVHHHGAAFVHRREPFLMRRSSGEGDVARSFGFFTTRSKSVDVPP